jgi:hypothetical protein
MMTREDARASAGLVVASGLAAAKQIPALRNGPAPTVPGRLRPSSPADLPYLFGKREGAEESRTRRVTRLSAAALVYSVDKKTETRARPLLRDAANERQWLSQFHQRRANEGFDNDRSCPHCRLLEASLYGRDRFPPIIVVNHSARVDLAFDPETFASEARIKDYRAIVPKQVAADMFRLFHPLHWADAPGSLFRRTDPVEADGKPWTSGEEKWEEAANKKAFMLEDTVWPLNDTLSSDSENVLRISEFMSKPNDKYELSYKYSLERCMRSNFGTAWEPSGLDIDSGEFEYEGVPLDDTVLDRLSQSLRPRDIVELQSRVDPGLDSALFSNTLASAYEPVAAPAAGSHPEASPKDPTREAVRRVLRGLESRYDGTPFYLVTVTASKALHFTIPEYGPIELWSLLTWMAPAFLFAFLHRAVTQAPHLLLKGP